MFTDGGPVALKEIVPRLDRLVAGSTAEATEISWLEVRRGQESTGKRRRDSYEVHERFYEVGSPTGLAELEAHLRGAGERL